MSQCMPLQGRLAVRTRCTPPVPPGVGGSLRPCNIVGVRRSRSIDGLTIISLICHKLAVTMVPERRAIEGVDRLELRRLLAVL